METNTEKIVAKLNALTEKNSDAEKGFKKASKIATAKTLANWFASRAVERRMFREELADDVHSFGYPSVRTPSLTGDLHRTWMDLKAAFSLDNDEAMIEETMRGEKAALDEYKEVLAEVSLPPATRALLKTHRTKIEHGLAILRTLDDIKFQEES